MGHVAIDETLLRFHGRIRFKTYNPRKPGRYGLLFRTCCDSTSHYLVNFLLYTGATCKIKSNKSLFNYLLTDLGQQRHLVVYADNFYTS